MSIETQEANNLIDFIYESPSPFHVIYNIKNELQNNGFQELNPGDSWKLNKGEKYFTIKNGSALFAFIVGQGEPETDGFKIISAHSDSPTIKIKPMPDITVDNHYIKVNTEVYGSPILMTWLDRPLSIAGRVNLINPETLVPEIRLVRFQRPLLTIPSLAIHLNRKVNEGMELNKQRDMIPLMGTINETLEKDNFLLKVLARKLGVAIDNILDFDLNLFETEKGCILGANNEFISSSRLDDLAMVHAGVKALTQASPSNSTQILAIFDNEEVGSITKQGAGSPLFRNIIERILDKLGKGSEAYYRAIYHSFMISADMAHAVHPNYPELHDPVHHPVLNGGPVIKYSANQKYTTDGNSGSVFKQVCKKAEVPYQQFVNRSDLVGGSTLGNVSTTQMDIHTVDIGNPMLAMHSIHELSGVKDHFNIMKVFKEFYNL